MNKIESLAFSLYKTVHGKGDESRESEFHMQNPERKEGWLRLARRVDRIEKRFQGRLKYVGDLYEKCRMEKSD